MKSLVIILQLFFSVPVFAQYTFGDPNTGRAYAFQKYSGVRGTPFLFDEWNSGTAYTQIKVAYKDVQLKLDICEGVLFFNFRDEPYEFRDNIVMFTLTPDPKDSSTYMYFKKGFSGNGINQNQYAQVLVEGQLNLIKVEAKQVSELNQINAGIVKSFTLVTKYFFNKKGAPWQQIKLTKNDISAIIGNNAQVLDFIKQNELSPKKEKDVIAIFKYFNSLSITP